MTDAAYRAKSWLMRADELAEKRERTKRDLMLAKSKLNSGVVNYYGNGKTDQISSQERHEERLIEYSELVEQFENDTIALMHENNITLRVIDRMKRCLHRRILIDRYVLHRSWKEICNSGRYEIKRSQLLSHHLKALEELNEVLQPAELLAIPTEKPPKESSSKIEQAL